MDEGKGNRVLLFLGLYWRTIFAISAPVVLFPIALLDSDPKYGPKVFQTAYVILVMACFWITECIPVHITSMIPIFAFPVFNILPTEVTASAYTPNSNMLFLGGLMVAATIEYSNLHKRIALNAIKAIGTSLTTINLTLMYITMFTSMWISNTATTAMMCPICKALLEELEAQGILVAFHKSKNENEQPRPTNVAIASYLGIAYSAMVGGVGTLIGTGTNLVFKGIFESRFPHAPAIDFLDWMLFSVPIMLFVTFGIWLWLQVFFLGFLRPKSEKAKKFIITSADTHKTVRKLIHDKLQELGKVTCHEISVAIVFLLLITLFCTRSPGVFYGWGNFLKDHVTHKQLKEATIIYFILFLLFALPREWSIQNFFYKKKVPTKPGRALIEWSHLQKRVPWGLMFLLGGGFALSAGSTRSGFSKWLSDQLLIFKPLPIQLLTIVLGVVTSITTNLSSNVAISNILIPVMAEMTVALETHPLKIMIPIVISCSFAFLLPVGTPVNSVAAAYGNLGSREFLMGGFVPTLLAVLSYTFLFTTYGKLYYDLDEFPDWAKNK